MTGEDYGYTTYKSNFNPHSREGSDMSRLYARIFISRISIHTPAKGVTSRFRNYWIFSRYFNPHSREGSDRPVVDFFAPYSISIHTPAKGVTIHTLVFFSFFLISIHTPAKGVTPLHSMFVHLLAISIHTPAKGVTTPFQSLSTLF